MSIFRRPLIYIRVHQSAGLVFLALSFSAAGEVPVVDANQEIHAAHQALRMARTEDDRVLHMRRMLGVLSRLDQVQAGELSDQSVDEVAVLLQTDGELGRYYGGRALAAIACRAHGALPALRKALSEATPIGTSFEGITFAPSVSSYWEVEKTIMKIEQVQPCNDSAAQQ